METLVLVAEHGNEYYRSRADGRARFGSVPSRGFRDINCRTFQSRVGILPTPLKSCNTTVTKWACSSPKTPSPSVNSNTEASKQLNKVAMSRSIPIPSNIKADLNKKGFFNEEFTFSELWAGPTYSNSPSPSSLPIPKFSLRSKGTVSLDLAEKSSSDMNFHPVASKSAPATPTRAHSIYFSTSFFQRDDSATKTLCRILNLDVSHE